MAVRVTRVLQYEYPDLKTAQDDMSRWTLQAPRTARMSMRQVGVLIDDWDTPKPAEPTPEPTELVNATPLPCFPDEESLQKRHTVGYWNIYAGVEILDPDGWRNARKDYNLDEEMTAGEWLQLAGASTMRGLDRFVAFETAYNKARQQLM